MLLLAALLAVPSARAQDVTPWVQMTFVDIDPTMTDEFLAAQRELTALDKDAGRAWRRVGRTAEFGHTYRYIIVTPLERFAVFDGETRTDPTRAALISRVQRCIVSRQSYAVRTLPSVDNPLPPGEAPSLMVVQVVTVVPGREQDYLRVMMSDVLPHFDEAEMHHTTGALTFGGAGGYIHVYHVENFAELDQGSPFVRVLGAEGAQAVTAKMSGLLTRSEQWLVRFLPDLSFSPESETETEAETETESQPSPR